MPNRVKPGTPPAGPIVRTRSNVPLYQLIARTLQNEIVRLVYPTGSALPSETDLMERFDVSRYTVRSAIRMLHDAGLVQTRHGKGSRILEPSGRHQYVHRINTISDLFPVDAITSYDAPSSKLLPFREWKKFFPNVGGDRKWLRVTGQRRRQGQKIPFNEIEILISERFANLWHFVSEGSPSIYTALETAFGEAISEVEQVIGTFRANGHTGSRIGLREGDMGIEVRRLHRVESDNDIALISLNRFQPDDYTFSTIFRRTANPNV